MDRRSIGGTSRGGRALSRRRKKVAGGARRIRDAEVAGPCRSQASQSAVGFARGVKGLGQLVRVAQLRGRHPEMLLRLFTHVLFAPPAQRSAANFLGLAEGDCPRGIELERLRPIEARK